MTMIRINLIAERKAGATKAPKKQSAAPSELQENIILIIFAAVAFGVAFLMWNKVTGEYNEIQARNQQLNREYKELEKYQAQKDEYDIRKFLLNQKIQKISELKDQREGPVKLMEDLANALPDSAWLESVWQGYDRKLVQAAISQGSAISPESSRLGDPSMVQVVGWAKTADSITNFADRILNLDSRYYETNLTSYTRKTNSEGRKQISFEIFFKVKKGSGAPQQPGAASGGGGPK